MINYLFSKIRFASLKRKIKSTPYIGKKDIDGAYLYKEDGYSIKYRIINLSKSQVGIEWVSRRRRLSTYEERIKRIKNGFFDFWHYQKWLYFLRPPILLILVAGFLLFYFEVIETQEAKMQRLKWIVAASVGINPKEIQYIGDGWLEISGQRKKEGEVERIKYTFNPLRWIFFSDTGFLRRWRSKSGEYTTYPVVYNERGDVWIKKKEPWQPGWQHGKISGGTVKWDTPQGSARIVGQETSTEDKKLRIIDK